MCVTVRPCHWFANRWGAFVYLVSVWQPQQTDRLPKRELVIWNNGLSTRRTGVTRYPVFPGSHNSLSSNLKLVKWIGLITLIEVLSCAHAPLLQFSYSARSVLSTQIHTQQSKCLSCRVRVPHIYTVGYGLNEHKQVCENWMCVSITCVPSVLNGQHS